MTFVVTRVIMYIVHALPNSDKRHFYKMHPGFWYKHSLILMNVLHVYHNWEWEHRRIQLFLSRSHQKYLWTWHGPVCIMILILVMYHKDLCKITCSKATQSQSYGLHGLSVISQWPPAEKKKICRVFCLNGIDMPPPPFSLSPSHTYTHTHTHSIH